MLQLKQEEKDGAGEVQEIALKDVIEWFEQLTPDEVAWLGPGIAFWLFIRVRSAAVGTIHDSHNASNAFCGFVQGCEVGKGSSN